MKPARPSSNILPIKLLFLSYLNNHEQKQNIKDCYNAINGRIQKFSQSIEENYNQILEIVGQNNTINSKNTYSKNKMMDVIIEEDVNTQRSNELEQESYKGQINHQQNITKRFNMSISVLQKASNQFEDTMFMYKKQLKEMAKDLTKERQLNKKLTKDLKQLNCVTQKQSRSNSVNKLTKKQNSHSSTSNTTVISSTVKALIPNHTKSKHTSQQHYVPLFSQNHQTLQTQLQQQQQIRQPPKPLLSQQSYCIKCLRSQQNKQNILHTNNKPIKKYKKQINDFQQKQKWKQLSIKITNLKSQLQSYQQQLIEKQSEILKLTEELKKQKFNQTSKQMEEKKKIKAMNTTLRGEKIVMESQIVNLKKKNSELQEYLRTLEADNKKLVLEKENLQSTNKWHQNTIDDLKKNFTSGLKEDAQLVKKLSQNDKKLAQSQNLTKILYQKLVQQQKYLEQFNENLKLIQQDNKQDLQSLKKKIQQLNSIIQQKNQTIIKIKLNSSNHHKTTQSTTTTSLNHSRINHKSSNKANQQQVSLDHMKCQSYYGTIMNKTLKKQLNSNIFNTTTQSLSTSSGFHQDMIKILNKKLNDKQYLIQRLRKENEILKKEMEEKAQYMKGDRYKANRQKSYDREI